MSYQTPGLGFALGLQQKGHSWGSQTAKPRPTYCRCCSGVFGLAWGKCTSYRWRLLQYHSYPVQREKHHDNYGSTNFIPQKIPRHSPSSLLGGTGSQGLQPSLPQAPVETHLGWISRWSGDGLVVMEDDEDQVPVTIEEMPAESWH